MSTKYRSRRYNIGSDDKEIINSYQDNFGVKFAENLDYKMENEDLNKPVEMKIIILNDEEDKRNFAFKRKNIKF